MQLHREAEVIHRSELGPLSAAEALVVLTDAMQVPALMLRLLNLIGA